MQKEFIFTKIYHISQIENIIGINNLLSAIAAQISVFWKMYQLYKINKIIIIGKLFINIKNN